MLNMKTIYDNPIKWQNEGDPRLHFKRSTWWLSYQWGILFSHRPMHMCHSNDKFTCWYLQWESGQRFWSQCYLSFILVNIPMHHGSGISTVWIHLPSPVNSMVSCIVFPSIETKFISFPTPVLVNQTGLKHWYLLWLMLTRAPGNRSSQRIYIYIHTNTCIHRNTTRHNARCDHSLDW